MEEKRMAMEKCETVWLAYLGEGTLREDAVLLTVVSLNVRVCRAMDQETREGEREEGLGATYINKQVFPQAPSPTMTSFRRISAIVDVCRCGMLRYVVCVSWSERRED